MAIFSPSMLGIESDRVGGSQAIPHNYTWAAAKSGVGAVLDGPMFAKCPSEPDSYALYQCGVVQYALKDDARGINIPSSRPSDGLTIGVLSNGGAVYAPGGYPPAGSVAAVQGYPTLLRAGIVEASRSIDTDVTWRAAVAIMDDGRLAFVVGNMSMYAFAVALKAAGAMTAVYTDGGGSASMTTGSQYAGSGEHRRVPAWIVARGGGFGASMSPALVPIALGLGVAWGLWWVSKRSW